jgi:hypothetical protein
MTGQIHCQVVVPQKVSSQNWSGDVRYYENPTEGTAEPEIKSEGASAVGVDRGIVHCL